jgi:uncharacterized membrane protein YphA (DoxX/SURF4 family)
MARRRSEPSGGLVLVRIVSGLVLLVHGWGWLARPGLDGMAIQRTVVSSIASQNGLVAWWGESVLLSNPAAIAFLWRWAALVLGLCLALGALTRPAGTLAAVFLLHGLVYGPASEETLCLVLATCVLGAALSGAGRSLGLDAALDRELPKWLTWAPAERSFLG